VGTTGSGDGELLRPAGLAVEKNGNVIVVDSGSSRLQVFTPDGKFVGNAAGPAAATASSTSLGGSPSTRTAISTSRLEEPSGPETVPGGKFLMKIGEYGAIDEPEGSYAVTYLGPYIAAARKRRDIPARPGSIIRPMSRWIPMATSTSPIGAIIGLRLRFRGKADHHLDRDAHVLSKWASRASTPTPT